MLQLRKTTLRQIVRNDAASLWIHLKTYTVLSTKKVAIEQIVLFPRQQIRVEERIFL